MSLAKPAGSAAPGAFLHSEGTPRCVPARDRPTGTGHDDAHGFPAATSRTAISEWNDAMTRPLAILCLTGVLAAGGAVAETRTISQMNGWTAFGGSTERGVPTCGLETRDPNTGRRLLLQHLAGQERPILRLSRPSWSLSPSTARAFRLVIDNRRILDASATASGQEMSWPLDLTTFEPAFRQGRLLRVEFPSGPDSSWNLSLTGTNAVMGAFMGCLRMMADAPIQPPPPMEAPVLAPPPPEPLRPPEAQGAIPRFGLPPDKPVPDAPALDPAPSRSGHKLGPKAEPAHP